jgi:hypothetical protein
VNLAARIAGIVAIATALGGGVAGAEQTSLTRTNLLDFLAASRGAIPPCGTTVELDPHLLGTVKRVFLRDPRGVYKADAPEDLRLTHLVVQEDDHGGTRLAIARMRSVPDAILTSVGRDAPSFARNLPPSETLATATNLGGFLRLLGDPDGGSSGGWGGFGTVHWTQEWTRVAQSSTNQLRYVNVVAHLSAPAVPASSGAQAARTNAVVDILVVREGLLRPADAKSVAELKKFPTADDIFNRAQAERATEREKYPQPLRALIEAKEKPDDPDAEAFVEAINRLRDAPDPKLIRQIVAAMNEDEVEFGSYLADLFGNDSDLEDVVEWKLQERQTAVRAVVEALPEVGTADALRETLFVVLVAQGGGRLKFTGPGTKAVVDLAVAKEGAGFVKTDASDGITDANAAQLAGQAQTELKQKFPGLWKAGSASTESTQ